MKNKKLYLQLVSLFVIFCLVFSLAGCIAVDNTSANAAQNVTTEYRHIKNTIHNYTNSGGSVGTGGYISNDSSDYTPQDNITVNPDNQNNTSDTNDDEEGTLGEDDILPPEINYDDVTVVPETPIFSDNFESYGETGTFILPYVMSGGDIAEGYVASDAIEGNYSARFNRTLGSMKWAAVYYMFDQDGDEYEFQNWGKQNYISLWAKSNGGIQSMGIGLNDGKNTIVIFIEMNSEWSFYCIPFTDYGGYDDFNFENVKQLYFTWGGGTDSCFVDDIRVTENEIKQYNKYIPAGENSTIENGEYYEGDALGVKAAYTVLSDAPYSSASEVTLDDSEKASGDYSVKFTAKPEEGKTYAAYSAPLATALAASSFNNITLKLKGDGTEGQKVKVMLYNDGAQVAASEDLTLTSDWENYSIPVTPAADGNNLVFDSIIIGTELAADDASFWLDDFVISNKDGVLATPADVIEDGEYYSDEYTVSDAYTNVAASGTVVSLDSVVKKSGNNSVKFNIPAIGGSSLEKKIFEYSDSNAVSVRAWGNNDIPAVITRTYLTPKDVSGSAGYIVINENTCKDIQSRITIFCGDVTSKTVTIYGTSSGERYRTAADSTTNKIMLSDLGITDTDLANVTGFKLEVWNCSGNIISYNCSISVPSASDVSAQFVYNIQPKTVSAEQHFELYLRGDKKAETKDIKVDVLDPTGSVIGAIDTEFTSDETWQQIYIVNETGSTAVAKTVRITFILQDTPREIWLDDFKLFTPVEPMPAENVIDEFEHYNAFFPIDERFTYEESAGFDTEMTVSLASKTDSGAKVRSGNHSMLLSCPSFPNGSVYVGRAYQDFTGKNIVINPGDTVSCWVSMTKNTLSNILVIIKTTSGELGAEIELSDNDWHQLTFNTSKLTDAGTITQIYYQIGDYNDSAVNYCVDDFVITRK